MVAAERAIAMRSRTALLFLLSSLSLLVACGSSDAEGDAIAGKSDEQNAEPESNSESEEQNTPAAPDAGPAPAAPPETPPPPPPPGTPPADAGFTLLGMGPLKNATGVCAQASQDVLRTAPCAADPSQTFAVYQMPDGGYELCIGDSMKVSGDEIHATCLARNGDVGLKFANVVLSKKDATGFTAASGHVLMESDDLLGWQDSARKLTKDSAGVVVLGKKSGNPDQKWTFGK